MSCQMYLRTLVAANWGNLRLGSFSVVDLGGLVLCTYQWAVHLYLNTFVEVGRGVGEWGRVVGERVMDVGAPYRTCR